MGEAGFLQAGVRRSANTIPWEERLDDHNNKISEYLQNRLFRGCSYETTIKGSRSILKRIFNRVELDDPTHPLGRRPICFWEFMDPEFGPPRLGLLTTHLLNEHLAPSTKHKYMSELLHLVEYVVAKPNIAGTSEETFVNKYGAIGNTFTKYDLPVHTQDRPQRNRYALSEALRDEFYEFLRLEYLPNHPLPHAGARDYAAIVLQAEIGARISELLAIRSGGDSCDVNWLKGQIRLFGKGGRFSGKRIRLVPLTAMSNEVLNVFEKIFKPMFPTSPESEYLFLNDDGLRLTNAQFWRNFRRMIQLAREFGVPVPEDLRPHDLRRTFATNDLEKNPSGYRQLLKKLGHRYPSSAAPYILATDNDVEDQQADLMSIFIDPYIEKRGTK
jgi:integrase